MPERGTSGTADEASVDRWTEYVIVKRWIEMKDGRRYSYAEPRQAWSRSEKEIWSLLVTELIAEHDDPTGLEVGFDMMREEWTKKGKLSTHIMATVEIDALYRLRANWATMGTLPLQALVAGLNKPLEPQRATPDEKAHVKEGIKSMRSALAQMAGRQAEMGKKMTRGEFQEAVARGWDAFGTPADAPKDDRAEPCTSCLAEATDYDPEGKPFCKTCLPKEVPTT